MNMIPGIPEGIRLKKYGYTVIGEFYLQGFEVRKAEDMDLRLVVEPAPGYQFVPRHPSLFTNCWNVESKP